MTLGISCHYHDAAAALVVDGTIEGALQQERLSRVKHDPSLPIEAAQALLKGRTPDRIVFYEDPFAKIERLLVHGMRTFPGSFGSLRRGLAGQLGSKLWVLDSLASRLGVPRDRVEFVKHHESHARAAFYTSGWDEAAVLTVDGVGEWTTTAIWKGSADGLAQVDSLDFPHSLGLLYAAITGWLGFSVNGGEYKVMGLAAFGKPTRDLSSLIQLHGDGSFTLDPTRFGHFNDPERGYGPGVVELLGAPRAPGRPWSTEDEDFAHWADVAASVQAVTEEAMLGLARRAFEQTGCSRLCLAGGVALNAVANRRLQAEGPFEQIWVQPAAGDAGGALGAALDGPADFTPFLGIDADAARAEQVAKELGLSVQRRDHPAQHIRDCLQRSELVGLCTGRCEWGPRALGHRSLLANPTDPATRDQINHAVKHREPFRPFAPVVHADSMSTWFSGEPDRMTPFMTTVRDVRGDTLGAVTHVDDTARVQTVVDGLFADIVGEGVVLNTSLNGAGEPICGTGVDALSFFLRHRIDALFIDDLEIRRKV